MRYLFLLFSILYFISCNNTRKTPEGVVPTEKMQRVLWDILRADELANHHAVKDTLHHSNLRRTELYQQVFQVHQITANDFKKSLQFYQSRPDLLQIIMDSLQSKASSINAMPAITPAP